jgi:hypothetical protein
VGVVAQPDDHAAARGHHRPPGCTFALMELLVRVPCRHGTSSSPGHARPAAARRPEERATLTVVPASAPTRAADRKRGCLKFAQPTGPRQRGADLRRPTAQELSWPSDHLWCTCYVPGQAVGADDLRRSRQTPGTRYAQGRRQVHRQRGDVSRATARTRSPSARRASTTPIASRVAPRSEVRGRLPHHGQRDAAPALRDRSDR